MWGCRVMLCGMGPVLECVDMVAKETTLSELGEMLAHVVEHMATKDDLAAVEAVLKEDIASVRTELKSDIAALGEQTASIERDLKQIRRDLYELADKVENIGATAKRSTTRWSASRRSNATSVSSEKSPPNLEGHSRSFASGFVQNAVNIRHSDLVKFRYLGNGQTVLKPGPNASEMRCWDLHARCWQLTLNRNVDRPNTGQPLR